MDVWSWLFDSEIISDSLCIPANMFVHITNFICSSIIIENCSKPHPQIPINSDDQQITIIFSSWISSNNNGYFSVITVDFVGSTWHASDDYQQQQIQLHFPSKPERDSTEYRWPLSSIAFIEIKSLFNRQLFNRTIVYRRFVFFVRISHGCADR